MAAGAPGDVRRLHRPSPLWGSQAWAALSYAGDGAVLGGESALRAAGMRRDGPALPIRVCVPHERLVREQNGIEIRRRRHLAALAHPSASLTRLRFGVAVLETASEQRGLGPAIGVIADACQQRLTTPAQLYRALSLKPRLRWRRTLAAVIDDVARARIPTSRCSTSAGWSGRTVCRRRADSAASGPGVRAAIATWTTCCTG